MDKEFKTYEVIVTMQAGQFIEARTPEEARELVDEEELLNQVRHWSDVYWDVKEL